MSATTETCLFVSRDGSLSVMLLDEPLPSIHEIPVAVARTFAMSMCMTDPPPVRRFKRTTDGHIPVYEEL